MSKKDCLNADWDSVGYKVGVSGNNNTRNAFNIREKACAKHGVIAEWNQFHQGHADGIVQHCQLDNAIHLGVDGQVKTIDNNVCPERDYPGFLSAFNAGYKLHRLKDEVRDSNSEISSLNSRIYRHEKEIRYIHERLKNDETEKSERKSLRSQRRYLRDSIYHLERQIDQCRQRLYAQQNAVNRYSDYLYEDYLFSLNVEFIDPRVKPQRKTNGKFGEIDVK